MPKSGRVCKRESEVGVVGRLQSEKKIRRILPTTPDLNARNHTYNHFSVNHLDEIEVDAGEVGEAVPHKRRQSQSTELSRTKKRKE